MTLTEFEASLEAIIKRPTPLRPFVCDGSPLDCKIFLVGTEPATKMSLEFWSFWRSGYGFEKAAWFSAYVEDRKTNGRRSMSPTRRNTEEFLAGAGNEMVLETNIYSGPRPRFRKDGSENMEPFFFLLEAIRPKVVFVHGREARRRLSAIDLDATIIEANHLSFQTSADTARRYGAEAAAASRKS